MDLAIAVIDEAGESISGWVYTPAGLVLMQKVGNFPEIYTSSYEVFPGTYQIKVGQDTMVTESDYRLTVYFRTTPFTVLDLEAAFGTRYQTLPWRERTSELHAEAAGAVRASPCKNARPTRARVSS